MNREKIKHRYLLSSENRKLHQKLQKQRHIKKKILGKHHY